MDFESFDPQPPQDLPPHRYFDPHVFCALPEDGFDGFHGFQGGSRSELSTSLSSIPLDAPPLPCKDLLHKLKTSWWSPLILADGSAIV